MATTIEDIIFDLKNGNEESARRRYREMNPRLSDEQFESEIRILKGFANKDYIPKERMSSNLSRYLSKRDEMYNKRSEFEELRKKRDQGLLNNEEDLKRYRELETELHNYNVKRNQEGGIGRAIQDDIRQITKTLENFWTVIKQFNDPWAKIDHAASKYSKVIGQSEKQYAATRKQAIKAVRSRNIGIDYNMSADELIAAQQSFAVGAGRNISLSTNAQEYMAAMTAVYGGKANELMVSFEKFGLGMEATGSHMGKMFQDAVKSGISLDKYAKNVQTGLALAQSYTFSGGLKSMERMAKQAAKIHMDMQQIQAVADKVGTVEGSITTAAKIQVLGGPFASMADPLGMLSESWGDMEGLADRLAKITNDIGHFNRRTGEVEVTAFNKQRLRAYAEATGQDYSKVMEQVHHQAKLNEIQSQIKSSSARFLDKDMQELIQNSATFKNGKAGVSINGEFKELSKLTNDDREALIKETQDQSADIKDIAKNLQSLIDKREGFTKQFNTWAANWSEHLKLGWLEKTLTHIAGHTGIILGIFKLLGLGLSLWAAGSAVRGATTLIRGGRGFFSKGLGGPQGMSIGKRISGIFSKGGQKGVQTIAKSGNTFDKATGVIRNSKGTILHGSAADKAARKMGLKTGEYARTKAEQEIFKNTSKQSTKKGIGSALTKVGGVRKGAEKTLTKSVGKVLGKNAYKALLKSGPKIMKAGGIAGAIGLAGSITEDILLANGKMKKGSTGHTALHIGSKAAEFAGWGSLLGPVGTIAGAALGTIVGSVQMAKIKREMGLDNKLSQMGIERKGNYGAKQLKKIDKALTNGKKISNRLRRKLEREGDFEMLAQIDAAQENRKAEKLANKEKRKAEKLERIKARHSGGDNISKIKEAKFNVGIGYFSIDKENKSNNKNKTTLTIPTNTISGLKNKKTKEEITITAFKNQKANFGIQAPTIKAPLETLSGGEKVLIGKSNVKNEANNPQQNSVSEIKPIDININGTLKLDCKNAGTIDIIKELRTNDAFKKEIARLIGNAINGYGDDGIYTPSKMK